MNIPLFGGKQPLNEKILKLTHIAHINTYPHFEAQIC